MRLANINQMCAAVSRSLEKNKPSADIDAQLTLGLLF